MKKILTLIIAITISIIAVSQEKEETTSKKEFGLTFRNLDEFGFSYKFGKNQTFWRFNTVFLSGNSENKDFERDDDINTSNFGIGVSLEKETRKMISDDLEYRFGADFSFNYNYSKSAVQNASYSSYYNNSNDYEQTKSNFFTPGLNLVFGLNYIIKEHLVLGIELMPYISHTFGKTSIGESYDKQTTEHSNFKYGISSSSVLLSIAYRI